MSLAQDLPVRFTDTPDKAAREKGVFKNARGWLRGWELDEAEQQRLRENVDDKEVVLKERPRKLFIKTESAYKDLPNRERHAYMHSEHGAEGLESGRSRKYQDHAVRLLHCSRLRRHRALLLRKFPGYLHRRSPPVVARASDGRPAPRLYHQESGQGFEELAN